MDVDLEVKHAILEKFRNGELEEDEKEILPKIIESITANWLKDQKLEGIETQSLYQYWAENFEPLDFLKICGGNIESVDYYFEEFQDHRIWLSSSCIEWDSKGDKIEEPLALTNVIHLEHMIRYLLFENEDKRNKISGKGSPNPQSKEAYKALMKFKKISDKWLLDMQKQYSINTTSLGPDNLPKRFEAQFRNVFYLQWGAVILDWINSFVVFEIHHKVADNVLNNHKGDHAETVKQAIYTGQKLRHSIQKMAEGLDDKDKLKMVHNELKELRSSFKEERSKEWVANGGSADKAESVFNSFRNDAFTIGLVMALAYYRKRLEITDPIEWRIESHHLINYTNNYFLKNIRQIENLYSKKSLKRRKYTSGPLKGASREVSYWKCGAPGDQITNYPIHRHLLLEIFYDYACKNGKLSGTNLSKFDSNLYDARKDFFVENIQKGDHARTYENPADRWLIAANDGKHISTYAFSKDIWTRIKEDLDKIALTGSKEIRQKQKKSIVPEDGSGLDE